MAFSTRSIFTVMESTPFDIEVAVDPEMLGKVFEELVTGRQATGSYYTPRPVVAFMCREALKGYLESRSDGLSPEAIQKFVDERDTSDIPLNAAPQVSRALDEITVVDPACGSGAYLLGMLQELVDLQIALFNVGVDTRSLHDLKLPHHRAQPPRRGQRRLCCEHGNAPPLAFTGYRI